MGLENIKELINGGYVYSAPESNTKYIKRHAARYIALKIERDYLSQFLSGLYVWKCSTVLTKKEEYNEEAILNLTFY